MSYFTNVLLLILSRGLALSGFFLLSEVMSQTDFKSYAIYFASWQFGSQLLSMQVGTTFFRCGIKKAYTRRIDSILALFIPVITLALLFAIITISSKNIVFPAIFMSIIVATFVIVSEYARAKISEYIVFIVFMFPGIVYLVLFGMAALLDFEITLQILLYVETFTYAFLSLLLLLICKIKFLGSYTNFISSVKKIKPFWVRVSLPLIPNNLLWYFYFNGPIILGYKLIENIEDFNSMAILFRFVVAISTVSSMFALVYQKKIISIFEKSKIEYLKIKKTFIFLFLPLFLGFCTCLYLIFQTLTPWFINRLDCMVCNIAFENSEVLIYLFFVFLSVYMMSHYFVAEKNLKVISPSMIIGFIFYMLAILVGFFYSLSFSDTSIYALCLSLSITLTIRYIWLLKNQT